MVAGHDGVVQEAHRIGQRGLGVALEQRRDGLQRQLRSHLALGVAAHAVGQGKQTGITGVAIAHAVFVLLAAALAADLVDGLNFMVHQRDQRRAAPSVGPDLPSGECLRSERGADICSRSPD